jgi:hypothetical protein
LTNSVTSHPNETTQTKNKKELDPSSATFLSWERLIIKHDEDSQFFKLDPEPVGALLVAPRLKRRDDVVTTFVVEKSRRTKEARDCCGVRSDRTEPGATL